VVGGDEIGIERHGRTLVLPPQGKPGRRP
jgi:hypothetical protein